MKTKQIVLGAVAGILCCGSVWAQHAEDQYPLGPANASMAQSLAGTGFWNGKPKEKKSHWTGNLVDASCMQKALPPGSETGTAPGESPATPNPNPNPPSVNPSRFADQTSQRPATGGVPAEQSPSTAPTYPGQSAQSTDITQAQAAQMAKASRVDDAARQCTATPSTQAFALALSGGQVVKFDDAGNTQASEALKGADVQAGKQIKAKVTGVVEDGSVVKIADVEVKGKRAPSATSSPASH